MRMKVWIAGLFSIAALSLAAEQASAWFWKPWLCCHKGTYLCCRPYNAFSPVCFGHLTCDGCVPFQSYGCHNMGASWTPACCTPSLVPNGHHPHGPHPYAMGGFNNGAGFNGQWLPQGGPYMAAPEPDRGPPPSYTAPPPAPLNTSWYNPHNPAPFGVQPASYPAGYYPGYWPNYPMGYWTNAYLPSQHGPWTVPNGR